MDAIYIQRRFTIQDPYGTFNDAITLLQADYNLLTQKQIDDTKVARLAAWKAAIDAAKTAPPIDIDKAILDTQAQIDLLTAQKTTYLAQKTAQAGGGK